MGNQHYRDLVESISIYVPGKEEHVRKRVAWHVNDWDDEPPKTYWRHFPKAFLKELPRMWEVIQSADFEPFVTDTRQNKPGPHENELGTHEDDSDTHVDDLDTHEDDSDTHEDDVDTHEDDSDTHEEDVDMHQDGLNTHGNDSDMSDDDSDTREDDLSTSEDNLDTHDPDSDPSEDEVDTHEDEMAAANYRRRWFHALGGNVDANIALIILICPNLKYLKIVPRGSTCELREWEYTRKALTCVGVREGAAKVRSLSLDKIHVYMATRPPLGRENAVHFWREPAYGYDIRQRLLNSSVKGCNFRH
ncbi:hypothetical protein M011DRAFT_313385 [Sporormia fimetaria CBS 119925]|uniref:Uncharacterized protein n=1 Tax=Sporormia fimetaria CBS 119925 TaxID=1340428 RepID=A0A6A6UUT9_9PLEO|nr:hypothetical protein M011DRAFT_313385 [Sporormia fimetaria CBS 119925]